MGFLDLYARVLYTKAREGGRVFIPGLLVRIGLHAGKESRNYPERGGEHCPVLSEIGENLSNNYPRMPHSGVRLKVKATEVTSSVSPVSRFHILRGVSVVEGKPLRYERETCPDSVGSLDFLHSQKCW